MKNSYWKKLFDHVAKQQVEMEKKLNEKYPTIEDKAKYVYDNDAYCKKEGYNSLKEYYDANIENMSGETYENFVLDGFRFVYEVKQVSLTVTIEDPDGNIGNVYWNIGHVDWNIEGEYESNVDAFGMKIPVDKEGVYKIKVKDEYGLIQHEKNIEFKKSKYYVKIRPNNQIDLVNEGRYYKKRSWLIIDGEEIELEQDTEFTYYNAPINLKIQSIDGEIYDILITRMYSEAV